jgi:hypothetical protein
VTVLAMLDKNGVAREDARRWTRTYRKQNALRA